MTLQVKMLAISNPELINSMFFFVFFRRAWSN